MKNKILAITVLSLISVLSFSMIIQPFSSYGNVVLVKEDMTALIKAVAFADIELSQNLLTIDNVNAFLNEEEIIINAETMEPVINNGLKVFLNTNIGAYTHLNLFGLRFVPYAKIDGNLGLTIPKTISGILFDNTMIGETIQDTLTNFLNANIMLNVGSAIALGPLYAAVNLYSPIAFADQNSTFIHSYYTSSATPAYAELNIQAQARILSRYRLNDIENEMNNITNSLLQGNINDFIQDYTGMSLEFGIGFDNFGIAVRNITISPAKATYAIVIRADGNVNYTAEGTDLTFDATYNIYEPAVSYLLEPVEVTPPIQITGYLKGGDFLMWGVAGSYWFDGNWMAKGYAGLNFGFLKLYYMLGMNPAGYAHTLGLGFNLFFANADLKLTSTTDQFIPIGQTTPGIGIAFTFSGGL